MGSVEMVGYLASALVFATFCMKAMLPLRLIAIASNVVFIVYGHLGDLTPIMLLHAALLPLNVCRLCQMLRSPDSIGRAAGAAGPSMRFLRVNTLPRGRPLQARRTAVAGPGERGPAQCVPRAYGGPLA